MRIGIVGGTGREGRGLALRWAAKGHEVFVGSRDRSRAREKAAELNEELPSECPRIAGGGNDEAAAFGEVVVLTVPYAAHAETLKGLKESLTNRILVDITVPLAPPKVTQVHLPPGTSAAMEAQALLDSTTRVVASLHHVSSLHLGDPKHPVDCDVLVCGDDESARTQVIALLGDLGVRALDAGVLRNAVALESLTPVLIHLNRKYKTNAGIKITGVP